MRRKTWVSGLGAVVAIGAVLVLLTTFASAASSGGAAHVRWALILVVAIVVLVWLSQDPARRSRITHRGRRPRMRNLGLVEHNRSRLGTDFRGKGDRVGFQRQMLAVAADHVLRRIAEAKLRDRFIRKPARVQIIQSRIS